MDVVKALGELYEQRKRLDSAIFNLEAKQRQNGVESNPVKKRGRKTMSVAERRAVSERMSEYWAARRAVQCSEPQSQDTPETDSTDMPSAEAIPTDSATA